VIHKVQFQHLTTFSANLQGKNSNKTISSFGTQSKTSYNNSAYKLTSLKSKHTQEFTIMKLRTN